MLWNVKYINVDKEINKLTLKICTSKQFNKNDLEMFTTRVYD